MACGLDHKFSTLAAGQFLDLLCAPVRRVNGFSAEFACDFATLRNWISNDDTSPHAEGCCSGTRPIVPPPDTTTVSEALVPPERSTA